MDETDGYFPSYGMAMEREAPFYRGIPRQEPSPQGQDARFAPDGHFTPDPEGPGQGWDVESELMQLLQASAGEPLGAPHTLTLDQPLFRPQAPPPTPSRRRAAGRPATLSWTQILHLIVASLTAVIATVVSVAGGMISYEPLQALASLCVPEDLARWWPLLIYGTWLVASLSILHSTVHRRSAGHSWVVVVVFSGAVVALSVADAPRNLSAMAVVALPPLTALTCFHQLVRQISLPRTTARHATSGKAARLGGGGSRRRGSF